MTEEERLIKKEKGDAIWVGEDGDIVCDKKLTELGARRKMMHLMRIEVGDSEAEEFWKASKHGLDIGYLHLVTQEERDQGEWEDDIVWYVSPDVSAYKLWWWRG